MNANILANVIADKIADKFSVVEFSRFCDECDIDHVSVERIAIVIEEVIVSCIGKDLR